MNIFLHQLDLQINSSFMKKERNEIMKKERNEIWYGEEGLESKLFSIVIGDFI